MIIPSTRSCGSLSIRLRLTNEPGSPSSALQIRYFGLSLALYRNSHFRPVENAAPPRPQSPDLVTSSITSTGFSLRDWTSLLSVSSVSSAPKTREQVATPTFISVRAGLAVRVQTSSACCHISLYVGSVIPTPPFGPSARTLPPQGRPRPPSAPLRPRL